MTITSMLFRLILALACGGAVGYGRSRFDRPAGLRTYMLVSVGAAAAVLLSLYDYEMLNTQWAEVTAAVGQKFDTARFASQTVAGIGFLGAGIIIKVAHQQVKGLTTAAGLWTTGIIGLAVGSGYYELSVISAALVLLAETVFAELGSRIPHYPEYTVEILYNEKNSLDNVLRYCKDSHMTISNLTIHTHSAETNESAYVAEVRLRGGVSKEELTSRIRQMQGIVEAMVT